MSAFYFIYKKDNSIDNFLSLEKSIEKYPFNKQKSFNSNNLKLGQTYLSVRTSLSNTCIFTVDCYEYYFVGNINIYNISELKNKLSINLNIEIPTEELIIRLYLKFGENFSNHILGDFSFCFYDNKNSQIICSRDHMGIKPLYYFENEKTFIFSDSIEVLVSYVGIDSKALNKSIINEWLVNYFVRDINKTFYEDINKLPRATELYFTNNNLKTCLYWDLNKIKSVSFDNEKKCIEKLNELLISSIEDRIKNVSVLGAHSSGGLDSTPISIIANKFLKKKNKSLHTFNWCKPKPEDEELSNYDWSDAREVAKIEGFSHHEIEISKETIQNSLLNHDISINGTTMYEYEHVLLPIAQKLEVDTILSGFGGDEILTSRFKDTHYDKIRRGRFIYTYKRLKLEAKNNESEIKICYRLLKTIFKSFIPKKILYKTQINIQSNKFTVKSKIFNEDLSKYNKLFNIFIFDTNKEKQLELSSNGYHQERLESWDSLGKKYGIEYVYPLLDKRIVEFAISLDSSLYYKNETSRYLYKQVLANYIPEFLLQKKKPPESYRVNFLLEEKIKALININFEDELNKANLDYINKKEVLNYLKDINIEEESSISSKIELLQSLTSLFFILRLKNKND